MGKAKKPRNRTKPKRPATRASVGRANTPPPLELESGPITLEELARRQGVKPFRSVEDFAGIWPEEFDPDEFLRWLQAERSARRQVAREKETDYGDLAEGLRPNI
jgi:hypothetical protein